MRVFRRLAYRTATADRHPVIEPVRTEYRHPRRQAFRNLHFAHIDAHRPLVQRFDLAFAFCQDRDLREFQAALRVAFVHAAVNIAETISGFVKHTHDVA